MGCGPMSGVNVYRSSVPRRVFVWMCCIGILGWSQGMFASSAPGWDLPEGRVYEMVSPPYKADYGVERNPFTLGATPSGENFVFTSLGAFSGTRADFVQNPYIARRGPEGWVTSPTNPPPADGRLPGFIGDYTPDLSRQVTQISAQKGGLVESAGTAALILGDLRAPEIAFAQAWPLPDGPASFPGDYLGASADLSHAIFVRRIQFGGGLFQIVGVGGPEPKEEALAVVGQPDGPGGTILPGCLTGSPDVVSLDGRLHAISEDGSEIFFSHCGVPYVRVNGLATFELSPAGEFWGASRDGSRAFSTNGAGELLMDMIDREPGHEAVSETVSITAGAAASVVVSSDDGSHVYFTSTSVLAGANAQGHSPEAGVSNLYVYDSVTRKTAFIAVAIVDGGSESQAQTTPDGRFLVFTTHARLTPDDTDTAADVYRYDAATGGLVRVSVGENGHDGNGNNNAFDASIAVPHFGGIEDRAIPTWRLSTRALSDDSSTVVFSTSEPLSTRALNGNVNIYVWHEGRVSMISTGLSQTPDEFPVVSQSGRDIFFLTSQSILPQDSDGLPDVYDARIGGGFPEPSVPAGGCSGDTCQGPPSVPSLLGAPASATFSGLGNSVAPGSGANVRARRASKCRRGYARDRKGRCVRVKRRARKGAAASRRGHRWSRGGRS
jgi:hypothetical protein